MSGQDDNYGRGKGFTYHVGKVVNVDSPYQDGSCQVRAYGIHDNVEAIPDDKLRWYKVLMPVTSGQTSGSAGMHGLQKDSTVLCMYLDDGEQIPIILGVLTPSGGG